MRLRWGGGNRQPQVGRAMPLNYELQRRVGIAVAVAATCVAATNTFRSITYESADWTAAIAAANVSLVLCVGLVGLISSVLSTRTGCSLQVAAFIATGLGSALDAVPGEITSFVYIGFGYLLAYEYGFLQKGLHVKSEALAIIYALALSTGVTVTHSAQPATVALSLIVIGLMAYLFWIMLDQRRKRHHERESELERQVRERTANVQERMAETERLKSELEQSLAEKNSLLEEKDVLLKEVHHRTKNNMQIVSSLLNLEKSGVDDPAALNAIKNSTHRIHTLALAHEHLYRSEDLVHIELSVYLRSLLSDVWSSVASGDQKLEVDIDSDISVEMDFAIPLGLVLNELVSNAAKHAFTTSSGGHVRVSVHSSDGKLQAEVLDNGRGLPDRVRAWFTWRHVESLIQTL